MENSIESLIAAQIERTYNYCKSPYLTAIDLVQLNGSIAKLVEALANYLAMKNNDGVVDNESD